jgi:hypothetical protein
MALGTRNQKPWIDGDIHAKLKVQTTAFNHGKVTGNMAEYKQCSYSLRKAIKQAKYQYKDCTGTVSLSDLPAYIVE